MLQLPTKCEFGWQPRQEFARGYTTPPPAATAINITVTNVQAQKKRKGAYACVVTQGANPDLDFARCFESYRRLDAVSISFVVDCWLMLAIKILLYFYWLLAHQYIGACFETSGCSVTKSLDVLCYGYNAGPKKLQDAREKDTMILNREEFIALATTGELISE